MTEQGAGRRIEAGGGLTSGGTSAVGFSKLTGDAPALKFVVFFVQSRLPNHVVAPLFRDGGLVP